ncbi:hypothetical protein ABKW28_10775 [Nocardioides sp. 31GB23]|uniref:hypothetical protein n=1 Tax=Nocardioides sp. 31GB23 TaxID=3156065 RepID=UPI0032AFAE4C
MSTMTTTTCPAWCTEHTGFPDSGDDWHQGSEHSVAGHSFYLSSGTISGEVGVFYMEGPPDEGVSLDDTEAFARALLAAVAEARYVKVDGGLPPAMLDVMTHRG